MTLFFPQKLSGKWLCGVKKAKTAWPEACKLNMKAPLWEKPPSYILLVMVGSRQTLQGAREVAQQGIYLACSWFRMDGGSTPRIPHGQLSRACQELFLSTEWGITFECRWMWPKTQKQKTKVKEKRQTLQIPLYCAKDLRAHSGHYWSAEILHSKASLMNLLKKK